MSSILEALRELEGERPPATRREIPPPEKPPGITRRATGSLIPVMGGLAVGVVAFGFFAWGPKLVVTPPPSSPEIATPPAPPAAPPAAAPATSEPPTWLDTADAPRARINRGSAPSERPPRVKATDAAPPPPDPAPDAAEASPEPRPSSSGGQVAVESISYSDNAAERVATLLFHGRRVTLRQRESIEGIEVQLIMPNGIYLQRGTETYLLPLSR